MRILLVAALLLSSFTPALGQFPAPVIPGGSDTVVPISTWNFANHDTAGDHFLEIAVGEDLTANRVLTLDVNDADRTLTISGTADVSGTNTGDVTLAGVPDYITIAGQVITRNQIDLTSDVTGILPVANGGTGQATALTLQNAYGNDADGSNVIITLTSADDSIEIDNPSAGGTDSTYVLLIDQNDTTGVDSLQIDSEATDSNALQITSQGDGGGGAHVDGSKSGLFVKAESGAAAAFFQSDASTAADDPIVVIFANNNVDDSLLLVHGDTATGHVVELSGGDQTDKSVISLTSTSELLTSGMMLDASYGATNTLANKSGRMFLMSSNRDSNRTSGTTADDFHNLLVRRTDKQTAAGGTHTAAGSVLRAEHNVTQSAGTMTSTVNVLEIVQDADSSGDGINIDMNGGSGNAIELDGLTFTVSATGVLDAATITEASNAVPNSTDHLGFFAATTSAQLAGVLSDETGSGASVFGTSPTFTTSLLVGSAGVSLADDGDGQLTFLGLGDGSDENWTINLDDTANTVVHGTSTGVTVHDWGAIQVAAGSFDASEGNITNVGNVALDSISADGTHIHVADNTTIGVDVSPDGPLHVHSGSAGAATALGVANDVVVEHSTNVGAVFLCPDASQSRLDYGSPSDVSGASIRWKYDTRLFEVGTRTTSGEVSFTSGNGVAAGRIDASQNWGLGDISPDFKLEVAGSIGLQEKAAADADEAGTGQIWVQNSTPNELMFTDDAGTDTQISSHADDGPDSLYSRIRPRGVAWCSKRVYKFHSIQTKALGELPGREVDGAIVWDNLLRPPIIESFEEYAQRHGATVEEMQGDGRLPVLLKSWESEQVRQADVSLEDILNWERRKEQAKRDKEPFNEVKPKRHERKPAPPWLRKAA